MTKLVDLLEEQLLLEKVSDFQDLFDIFLKKAESKIWKLWPRGKMSFRMKIPKDMQIDYGYGKIKDFMKIRMHFDMNPKWPFAGQARNLGDYNFAIKVNTSTRKADSRSKALGVVAHELTHVSQKFNNFLRIEHKKQRKKHADSVDKKLSYKQYYNKHHSDWATEHEATLVNLGYHLMRDAYSDARDITLNAPSYFIPFKVKDFMKKLAYLGVTNRAWMHHKRTLQSWLGEVFVDHSNFSNPLTVKVDWLLDLAPLFKKWKIPYKPAIKWVEGIVQKAKENPMTTLSMAEIDKIEKTLKKIK